MGWPLLLGVLACGAPDPGTVVRVGTDVDAETLDPRLHRNTTAYRVANLLFDGLVELDEALNPVPGLAETWEQPDDTTWVFHLREARFHDGVPVTAGDVVYTYESVLDPDLRAPLRMLYAPIRSVEAVDSMRVRFVLRHPYAPFLRYLDLGIVPRHLGATGHPMASQPVGAGPFRLMRWDRGSRVVLERFERYWAGVPTVDRVDVILVPDNTARAQAFAAGDLDIIQSPLAPQDVHRLRADDRFAHDLRAGIAITYLNFNSASPVLGDPALRRALAKLVDQATIVSEIYEGMDEPASSILLPAWTAFDAEIRQPPYDPSAALRELDALEWRDTDGDGVRERDGTRLSFRLGTHSEDVNRVQTVEFLQHAFAQAGVEARVEISDWPSHSARRDAGDFDLILQGWTQIIDPDRIFFEQMHSRGGLNWGGYRDDELDRLLERGRRMQASEARDPIYQQAAAIVARDVPYYVISYQQYQVFVQPRVRGFEPDLRGMLRSLARATLAPN